MDKPKKSLYGITQEFATLEGMLMDVDGEITPELEEALMINRNELETKSEGYISVIAKKTARVSFIDAEIKRLQAAKKAEKNVIDRLKDTIKNAMLVYDIESIETPLHRISFRKSESVSILIPAEELADKLKLIKTQTIPLSEIKKMLKAGETFEGVSLMENKNLQIK